MDNSIWNTLNLTVAKRILQLTQKAQRNSRRSYVCGARANFSKSLVLRCRAGWSSWPEHLIPPYSISKTEFSLDGGRDSESHFDETLACKKISLLIVFRNLGMSKCKRFTSRACYRLCQSANVLEVQILLAAFSSSVTFTPFCTAPDSYFLHIWSVFDRFR